MCHVCSYSMHYCPARFRLVLHLLVSPQQVSCSRGGLANTSETGELNSRLQMKIGGRDGREALEPASGRQRRHCVPTALDSRIHLFVCTVHYSRSVREVQHARRPRLESHALRVEAEVARSLVLYCSALVCGLPCST